MTMSMLIQILKEHHNTPVSISSHEWKKTESFVGHGDVGKKFLSYTNFESTASA